MVAFPDILRPVHETFRRKKFVCLEQNCYKEMLFFGENGLGHHFDQFIRRKVNAKGTGEGTT